MGNVLGKGENIVVDKGMFYGAQGSVKIKAIAQKNLSADWLGEEGWEDSCYIGLKLKEIK